MSVKNTACYSCMMCIPLLHCFLLHFPSLSNILIFIFGTEELHIGGQEHFYMETQSVLVVPKGEAKEMDVYVSSQHPALIQVTAFLRKFKALIIQLFVCCLYVFFEATQKPLFSSAAITC